MEDLRRIAPGGVNRIIDVAIGANFAASLKVIAPNGVLVSYASEAQDPVLPVRALMTANATIRFLLVYNFAPHRVEAAISDITEALKEGRIQPLPTTILPLEAVAEAHAMVERGIFGRVLLDVRG